MAREAAKDLSRRQFLKSALAAGAAAGFGFPTIVPAAVIGANPPSNRIQIAMIGCGRIARSFDLPGLLKHPDEARVVAVCDLDSIRLADGKAFVEAAYAKRLGVERYEGVRTFANYREMLAAEGIDAVCIATPDHWHALPAIEAALAGKDVYLQKPASLTIAEGRQLADVIARTGRIFQTGSQLRSAEHFRLACELVRNGRIGKIREVVIGVSADPAGGNATEMPVPGNLNYEMWLGSTPEIYYTEDRVHPRGDSVKSRYGRPGWLRCEQFGAGMITGWGAHEYDTAHWAMGSELTGPLEVEATAEFPKEGLWDVHGTFMVRSRYANGAEVSLSDRNPKGTRFIGEEGWIYVSRGSYVVTASDPGAKASNAKALDASDPALLTAPFGAGEIRLHASPENDHHLDWLTSIRTREEPVAPAESAHRSCSACLMAHAAMKLGRKLSWDPAAERFLGDDDANATLARPQRAPYGTDAVLAKATLPEKNRG